VLRRAFDQGWPSVCQSVPRRVKREAEGYLRCGDVRYGFVEVSCVDCQQSRLVASCCKAEEEGAEVEMPQSFVDLLERDHLSGERLRKVIPVRRTPSPQLKAAGRGSREPLTVSQPPL